MSPDGGPLGGFLLLLIIIIVRAFVAASERSLSSLNKSTIREMADEGDARAKSVQHVLDNINEYRLGTRTFVVLLDLASCLVAILTFNSYITYLLLMIGLPVRFMTSVISMIILVLLLGLIIVSFGLAFPRRLGVLHAEGIALKTVWLVRLINVIFKPMTILISGIVFILLKICRQRTDVSDNEYSEEDIVSMLEAGQESGEIKEEGKKMITGIFAFDDMLAYEAMTPRTDVFAIDINDPSEEYMDELMTLKYSRIPVYEDDSDNIIGILNVKDYLRKARDDGFENVNIREILRKPYFVPETKNIDSLFFEMQKAKQQIAVLIDEYGGFSGIVTMEDIIEEVMGDIDDEYDEEQEEIAVISKDLYRIDGGMDLDDLNEELGLHLESENSETIGGFLLDMFGEIPDEDDIGKEIEYENLVFTIKTVKDRRIETILMKVNQPPEEEETDER